jgi:hypothetical protein
VNNTVDTLKQQVIVLVDVPLEFPLSEEEGYSG